MTTITPEAVSARLQDDDSDLVVLDIRPRAGFEDWHIPGSEHIDVYDELKADPQSAAEALEQLPRDSDIVTVCGVGKVSAIATDVLRDMGYSATTLVDGMQGWGRVHRSAPIPIDSGDLIQIARPGTGCLSYVFISDGEAIVIDPSQYIEQYEDIVAEFDATITGVLETHAHADHVSGAQELAANLGVLYYLHPADSGDLAETTDINEGQQIDVGYVAVDIIHTPGHTEGSVTYAVGEEALLTGDTLFLESVGRPDLEGGDDTAVQSRAARLYQSLQSILENQNEIFVLPAHDSGSPSPPISATLGEVREQNYVLGLDQSAFVDAITANIPETPPNHEQIKEANVGGMTLDEDEARKLELGPNQCAAQ